MRSRGFLLGGTAGRTTLNGEGLQHEDGHSHLLSATIPNCISYDPTFAYEVAVIIQDGLRRMYAEQEDVYYYLTVMNENYPHPAMPEGARAGILKGMYLLARRDAREGEGAARAAAGLGHDLARGDRGGRPAEERLGRRGRPVELPVVHRAARDGIRGDALEHAASDATSRGARTSRHASTDTQGPGDRGDRLHARVRRQIRAASCRAATSCSAPTASAARTRARSCATSSRSIAQYVAVAALKALADEGDDSARRRSAEAIAKYGLDPDKPAPWTV